MHQFMRPFISLYVHSFIPLLTLPLCTHSLQDTEFPGVVARPIGEFGSQADYQYQLVKCNVNLLKLIQLGLTFYDASGMKPPGPSTFQFNFQFSLG